MAITAWDLTYECIVMSRLRSTVSSEKSKYSSHPMALFILALMASNDEIFAAESDEFFRANTVSYFFYCSLAEGHSRRYLRIIIYTIIYMLNSRHILSPPFSYCTLTEAQPDQTRTLCFHFHDRSHSLPCHGQLFHLICGRWRCYFHFFSESYSTTWR